jgi:signal transduction histidine kinase
MNTFIRVSDLKELGGKMTETLATARSSDSYLATSLEAKAAVSEYVRGGLSKPLLAAQSWISTDNSPAAAVKLRVLLVEDNPCDVELVLFALRKDGFDVSSDVVQTVEDFALRVQATTYDVILADYNLPQWRGTEALDILRRDNLEVPLIVVTGYLGEEKAVECIKEGATDCVLKDHLARLPLAVTRALEEKRLRLQRRQSREELARSNAELEQFAYVASHDLQEPLRMIANYTQLLAERYRGQLDEQADKYIGYAVDGAIRMQALIHDLLKFSQLGKQEIEPKPADCCVLVAQAVKNLQAAVQESGAVVHCSGLPIVMADPVQLTQVFQNLIANAIKFRGVELPVIQIDAERSDHEWVLTVSDNGIGIPAESWKDIFVIFRRLHTRSEYPGNGMGLAICKKIIERYGGKLWIEAQAQPGSRFRFTLPAETHSNPIQKAQL